MNAHSNLMPKKSKKQFKCPSTSNRLVRCGGSHIMEYYSAIHQK